MSSKRRRVHTRDGYTTTKKADVSKLNFSTRPGGAVKRPSKPKSKSD